MGLGVSPGGDVESGSSVESSGLELVVWSDLLDVELDRRAGTVEFVEALWAFASDELKEGVLG